MDRVPGGEVVALRVAGRGTAGAREVPQDLGGALVAAEDRLPEAPERPERRRPPQPEDLLCVLERERVPYSDVELEHVRAEPEREEQDRRRAQEPEQAPPAGPQQDEEGRNEREPDQPCGDGERAEDAGAQRASALREEERPRDEREEERVRLRRREDERERIQRHEEERVHGPSRPEQRTRDPDERDGCGGCGDERDQDARDDRR